MNAPLGESTVQRMIVRQPAGEAGPELHEGVRGGGTDSVFCGPGCAGAGAECAGGGRAVVGIRRSRRRGGRREHFWWSRCRAGADPLDVRYNMIEWGTPVQTAGGAMAAR